VNSSTIKLPAVDGTTPVPPVSKSERGRRLFAGKGCVTCHGHELVGPASVQVGPNLTGRRFDPVSLKQFLANPPQTAPNDFTGMPNLRLREREIDELVAFINNWDGTTN
jgi:mono/diheme cytochrome c family protein